MDCFISTVMTSRPTFFFFFFSQQIRRNARSSEELRAGQPSSTAKEGRSGDEVFCPIDNQSDVGVRSMKKKMGRRSG